MDKIILKVSTIQGHQEGGYYMGYKYHINGFNYPWQGYWEKDYGTNSFIKFLFMLIKFNLNFDGIEVQIRQ